VSTLIKDRVTILNTYPYSDSSLIVKALGRLSGNIDIIAKGIRKKSDSFILQVLNDYELTLYAPREGELHLLKESNLIQERHYQNPKNWATALCGAELMQKQLISPDENRQYYELLSSFLDFLIDLDAEPLPVFWRLLNRIIHLQGLELKTCICSSCKQQKPEYAYTRHDARFYCQRCTQELAQPRDLHILSEEAARILFHLDHIGNHLHELKLSKSTIQEINDYFEDYYLAHNRKTLKLKSLSVLEQFYI
jgi:DNA repair protein RecO